LAAIEKKLSTNFEIAQPKAWQTVVAVSTPSWTGRPGPPWTPRGAMVNSTVGVGIACCRSERCQNRFSTPPDRRTGAPTGERQENLVGRRLKQTGARLQVNNVNRIAELCCLAYSDQWGL
jgi:hypothetical protein